VRGLYGHIPFCVQKCRYCDFYSLPERLSRREPYLDAVLRAAQAYAGLSFQTLYLGGGTPSLLGPELLTRLLDGLRRTFDLGGLAEATIEVNPESATREFLGAARDNGINRLSVGVQSLADEELKAVGRVHTAAQALQAVSLARQTGFASLSADLMVGLPGQTWPSLSRSLETLVVAGVAHLSVYCLSLEKGTPLAEHLPADLPSEDAQAELFLQAKSFLEAQGFSHYEISNFARPGHECAHNINYWRGGEYLGLGPAAASHLDGRRFRNRPDLDAYLAKPDGLREDDEALSAVDKVGEEAMLRLRLLQEGIDLDQLSARFGADNTRALAARLQRMYAGGRLVKEGPRYRLPPGRILTSNPIFAEVLDQG